MRFAEIAGQKAMQQKLIPLIQEERIPHALLISGNEGTGALPMALAIAQMVVCERARPKQSEGGGLFGEALPTIATEPLEDACGECAACLKAQKNIHPDIHFTFPVYKTSSSAKGTSNEFINEWRSALATNSYLNLNDWLQHIEAENKQGNITTEECRGIVQSLSLKSFESDYKVYIIWMAEQLRETGNILLKVIEEPPPKTLFIFVVQQMEQMIGTILSRTQILKLPPLLPEEVASFLEAKENIHGDTALRLAKIADGNLNQALKLTKLETNEFEALLQKWFSTSIRLLGNHASEASITLQEISDEFHKLGRENQKAFLQYATWMLREITFIAQKLGTEKLSESEFSFASKVATLMEPESAKELLQIFEELQYHIERNANPKINLYSASFKMAHIFTQK